MPLWLIALGQRGNELKPQNPDSVRDRPKIRSISDHLRTRFPNLISSGPIVVERLHELHSLFKFIAGRHPCELAVLKLLKRCLHRTSAPFVLVEPIRLKNK
jgi:hypothetical protein